MTYLERNIVNTSFSTRGILYSLMLLLLVVSLFFIPEIVHFQESVTGKSDSRPGPSASVKIEELIPDQAVHPVSSLDRVLLLMNSGYLEGKEKDTEDTAALAARGSSDVKREIPSASLPELSALEDRVQLERTLQGSQLTWDKLSSTAMKRSLKQAQDAAAKILRGLGEHQSAVRFALINYINGLAWVMKGDKKLMTADEAIAYIEQLDINVTQVMLTNEIDSVDYTNWKKVSLGPIIGTSRAVSYKGSNGVIFNPRFTLMEVNVSRQADYVKMRNQWVRRIPPSNLSIQGFVMGKDVKKIVAYKNGRKVSEMSVSGRPNQEGIRPFKWRTNSADGVFTFRVISKSGDPYEKSYTFTPRLIGKFQQDKSGTFLLPFGNGDFADLSMKNLDTRLDRYFRVGGKQALQAPPGFEAF